MDNFMVNLKKFDRYMTMSNNAQAIFALVGMIICVTLALIAIQ